MTRWILHHMRSAWTWTLAAFLTLGLGLSLTPDSWAQTPDGETPAEESVCDPLKADGITKGLYGLCIAFCEAQDIDVAIGKANAQGDSLPGDNLLRSYERKRTVKDPDMPCLQAPTTCPCFNTKECELANKSTCQINDVVGIADLFTQTVCDVDVCDNQVTGRADLCYEEDTAQETRIDVRIGEDQGYCVSVIDGKSGNQRLYVPYLTREAAQACIDQLDAYDGNDLDDGNVKPCGL